MQNKYLVGIAEREFSEGEFRIVLASSIEEATEKFIRDFAANDELFSEYVRDKSVNMSFASHFWMQTEDEESHFDQSGEIKIDAEEFKKRVRDFFGEHGDYADAFIKSYFADENNPDINAEFPEGMLAYIWLNSDYSKIKAFDLEEIEEIEF